jgi:hypothetical protein
MRNVEMATRMNALNAIDRLPLNNKRNKRRKKLEIGPVFTRKLDGGNLPNGDYSSTKNQDTKDLSLEQF